MIQRGKKVVLLIAPWISTLYPFVFFTKVFLPFHILIKFPFVSLYLYHLARTPSLACLWNLWAHFQMSCHSVPTKQTLS